MRQSNHNFPPQNRAAVVISNALYDRRAFDSPISTLPLLSSLTHLSYLTSTSPRIREILTVDGGLERLVYIAAACIELAHNSSGRPTGVAAKCTCMEGIDRINNGTGGASSSTGAVSRTCACLLRRPRGPRFKAFSAYSKRAQGALSTTEARVLLMTYTLALQSLVNVGVRGSEHIRTRVVQAGVLALAVRVLRGFLAERARQAAELASGATMANLMSMLSANHASLVMPSPDSEAEATLPPVTRTPTPDATTLVAEEVFASEAADVERLEDEPQEAEADDVEMEAPSAVRARSATIKSGPSPPTDIVNEVVDMEEDDDAMDVDDDASPPESAGESDGETEADTMAISAPPRQMSPVAGLDETPRPPVRQLPNAAFEGSPISPHIHLVTPAPSTSALALAFRFREDDVLLCLQLLAYLSKYPHVRAVFHEPDKAYDCAPFPRNPDGSPAPQPASEPPADPSKNVFSLVEKFTVRPSPNDRTVQRLPSEIQYWAGVIMRNACRKDESRGGIRQCANMLCGAWEKYPREFAKCRRCRKAKYCSKNCQSKAWQGGHRYWCSARDPSDQHGGQQAQAGANAGGANSNATMSTTVHEAAVRHAAAAAAGGGDLDDDDDALADGVPTRPPQPRTHILLRHTTMPGDFATPTAQGVGGPVVGVNTDDDVQLVGVNGTAGLEVEDAEDAVTRFF